MDGPGSGDGDAQETSAIMGCPRLQRQHQKRKLVCPKAKLHIN